VPCRFRRMIAGRSAAAGCHRYFYKTRCKVCDRPSQNGRLCSGKCRYAFEQNRNLYTYQSLQMADNHQNRSGDSNNPYRMGIKTRAKTWGPTLSDDSFWLATIPLHSADKANAKRANARAELEPVLGKPKVLFGPATPSLNIIGGYRFPGALAVDLAAPANTEAAA
jgi:hypothetical protein